MKKKPLCTLSLFQLNRRLWPLALLCLIASVGVRADGQSSGSSSCPSCTIDVTNNGANLTWSVQYLVDADTKPSGYCCNQTIPPATTAGDAEPDDNRGLALSPTGQFLYAGYNNGQTPCTGMPCGPDGGDPLMSGRMGEVRKIDVTQPKLGTNEPAVVAFLYGFRGKAIATDDLGHVYLAEGNHELNNPPGSPDSSNRLVIYDANLSTQLFNFVIGAPNCPSPAAPGMPGNNCLPGNARPEGVAVVRQGTNLVLWVSDRSRNTLDEFVSSGSMTSWTFAGEKNLSANVPPAISLRGVDVDPTGRVWIADADANGVFVVTPTTPLSASAATFVGGTISGALDVALDAKSAFVTMDTAQIQIIDQATLALNPMPMTPPYGVGGLTGVMQFGDGAGNPGRLSGIVLACPIFGCTTPGLYVSNEAGVAPGESDFDREPILRAAGGTFTPCVSCGKVTGGGQIPVGTGYANFGFNVQVKKGVVKGELEYLDHTTGNPGDNWHSLSMTSLMVSSDLENATFTGTIKRKNDPLTYNFCVYVEDNGEPGHGVDKFEFEHAPQPAVPQCATKATDTLAPTIAKGNIQIHKKPDCD